MTGPGPERASSTFVKHELIGLDARIADSTDPTLRGFEGLVVDETRNTLIIEGGECRRRIVAKDICVFEFHRQNGKSVRVEGSRLRFRPEDRIKKAR